MSMYVCEWVSLSLAEVLCAESKQNNQTSTIQLFGFRETKTELIVWRNLLEMNWNVDIPHWIMRISQI